MAGSYRFIPYPSTNLDLLFRNFRLQLENIIYLRLSKDVWSVFFANGQPRKSVLRGQVSGPTRGSRDCGRFALNPSHGIVIIKCFDRRRNMSSGGAVKPIRKLIAVAVCVIAVLGPRQTLYHGGDRLSRVILPILKPVKKTNEGR